MEAKDLMIGDWVRIKEPDRYAGALATIRSLCYHKEDECAYIFVFIQGHGYGLLHREVCNEDLEPIPLTPEILKKNGFVRDGESWWYRDFRIVLSTSKGIALICNRQNKFAYIHQLQHALRLCGIDKEIVI